jgi:hypothetical protein
MTERPIFIPEAVFRCGQLPDLDWKLVEAETSKRGLQIKGYVALGDDTTRQELIERCDLDPGNFVIYAACLYEIFSHGIMVTSITFEPGHPIQNDAKTTAVLEKEVAWFSQNTGMSCKLFITPAPSLIPPQPGKDEINIVLGTRPVDNSDSTIIRRSKGEEPYDQWNIAETRVHGPSHGIGMIVVDEADELPIAQIVDNTFYLFVPVDRNGKRLLNPSTGGLFFYALRLAWHAYLKGYVPPVESSLASSEDYCAMHAGNTTRNEESLAGNILRLEQKIAETLDYYRELLKERQVLVALHTINVARSIPRTEEQLRSDWNRMQAIHDVDHYSIVEDGLHISMKSFTIDTATSRHPIFLSVASPSTSTSPLPSMQRRSRRPKRSGDPDLSTLFDTTETKGREIRGLFHFVY